MQPGEATKYSAALCICLHAHRNPEALPTDQRTINPYRTSLLELTILVCHILFCLSHTILVCHISGATDAVLR